MHAEGIEGRGEVVHFVLYYIELPVAVSCAFMLFSKQFNTDSQCPLMELNGFGIVMHVVLCCTDLPVAISCAFMFFSKQFNAHSQCTLMGLKS